MVGDDEEVDVEVKALPLDDDHDEESLAVVDRVLGRSESGVVLGRSRSIRS